MEAYRRTDILSKLCSLEKRWGLYISIICPEEEVPNLFHEAPKACLFLKWEKHSYIITDGQGWFLFDTQEECETAFAQCVGEDGPTKLNSYTGKIKVYALTCAPDGQLSNENT